MVTFQDAPATSSPTKRARLPERVGCCCTHLPGGRYLHVNAEAVCAEPRCQRLAQPVSMEPSWCAPTTPSLISFSHPSSSPEYAARSPWKVSHCNDDFSRREAGRQKGEKVSGVRQSAWEPGPRRALHNEKRESCSAREMCSALPPSQSSSQVPWWSWKWANRLV